MSRSGYHDDLDQWEHIKYRGQVASATRGQRGQQMLRDLLDALDNMEPKRLIANELETKQGEVCALGALGLARGVDMSALDPYDRDEMGEAFGIAEQLAAEVVFMNDEAFYRATPEQRWMQMREWVASQIVDDASVDEWKSWIAKWAAERECPVTELADMQHVSARTASSWISGTRIPTERRRRSIRYQAYRL